MSTSGDGLARGSADLLAAAERSALAEVGFRTGDGPWEAAVLVPLVADGRLTFALPYAERPLATALSQADEVLLVCSDARLALRGWAPAAGRLALELSEDADGERFAGVLLDAELRKHPPARVLADSALLRREHWWYLPRLLLDARIGAAWAVAARTSALEGVLFADDRGDRPADTVALDERPDGAVRLISLAGAPLHGAGHATVLRHDAAMPDLEQRSELVEAGRRRGDVLAVDRRRGGLALPRPAGLLARYRSARSFGRACRTELARSGRGRGRGPRP